jgi:hypothetical protein
LKDKINDKVSLKSFMRSTKTVKYDVYHPMVHVAKKIRREILIERIECFEDEALHSLQQIFGTGLLVGYQKSFPNAPRSVTRTEEARQPNNRISCLVAVDERNENAAQLNNPLRLSRNTFATWHNPASCVASMIYCSSGR